MGAMRKFRRGIMEKAGVLHKKKKYRKEMLKLFRNSSSKQEE